MKNGNCVSFNENLLGVFFIALYFLPWLEAMRRWHSKTTAIGVLNVLLGWTFIGWAIALVWACTENKEKNT